MALTTGRLPGSPAPLDGLLHLSTGYLGHGRQQLVSLGDRVIAELCLAPGMAEADLVVGRTLVEVKTNLEPLPYVEEWLDQVLAYLLLDRWNSFHLTDVAVYAGSQSTFCRTSVDAVLQASAPGPTPKIHDVREAFHEAMRDDLAEALQSHLRRQYPAPADAWARRGEDLD